MLGYSLEDKGTTKRFIPEFNSLESIRLYSCPASLKLTLTWVIDILFEKLTPGIW